MKTKRLFFALSLSSLLIAGTAAAFGSAKQQKNARVTAATDIGAVTISEVRNVISNATAMYLLPTQNYSLPDSWDYPYTPVGDSDGVFVNGVKQSGAVLKYAGTGSAYITFYYGLPTPAIDGDVVEFKGTFATESDGGYTFSIDFTAQRFGTMWVHELEDYDTVSLADANMPDYTSASIINTDDMGGDYAYTTDRYALPTRKGYFGLTNDTGSYAFQFNYQKTATATGWFHVLIGGRGPLWNAGHFMDFMFLDNWADTGHAMIKEYTGKGNYWEADQVQATDAIPLGWNVGQVNLLEMGLIKVKGSSQRLVFFKVNGTVKYGEYWTLAASGEMTTKVTLQYSNTDARVTNSLDIVAKEKLHYSSDTSTVINLSLDNDICPAIHNWSDFFMSVSKDGLKLNGVAFGNENWNYFKKTGSTGLYLDLSAAGVNAISAGDILYIGGVFKTAKILETVDGVNVLALYKVVFVDSYFTYNGTSWVQLYEAKDFAKDLLKMTMSICTGGDANNHDALATVWATLAGANYYGLLNAEDKETIQIVEADPTIVVPSTESGIDAMDNDDAICAAMYRYDYCTAKYSLTNFVTGRSLSVSFSRINIFNNASVDTESMTVVIIVAAIVLISAAGFFWFCKRKQNR